MERVEKAWRRCGEWGEEGGWWEGARRRREGSLFNPKKRGKPQGFCIPGWTRKQI
jgi:hypothetical protein